MNNSFNKKRYIFDVITLAFSAFGGPQAHVAMLFDLFVDKRKYLKTEELIELNALCSFLPGPTSTQTIIATGHRLGGIPLALLTFFIWITPAGLCMIIGAIFIDFIGGLRGGLSFTIYLQAAAIGLIINAAITIFNKVVKDSTQKWIVLIACLLTFSTLWFYSNSFWVAFTFPITLAIGGFIAYLNTENVIESSPQKLNIKWLYLVICVTILGISMILTQTVDSPFIDIFERMYRNGLFIYGGGQVLMPILHTEFVEQSAMLQSDEFFSGMSLASGVPGPMFSIAGYIGVLGAEGPLITKIGVGLIGLLGIFLPGTLLIFFIAPIWESLKQRALIQKSIKGINAAACGLIVASVPILFLKLPHDGSLNTLIIAGIAGITFVLAKWKLVPVPLIIGACLIAGLAIPPVY